MFTLDSTSFANDDACSPFGTSYSPSIVIPDSSSFVVGRRPDPMKLDVSDFQVKIKIIPLGVDIGASAKKTPKRSRAAKQN